MDDVALWAVVAVGLLVAELLTLSLVAVMFSVAAVAALGLALAGAPGPVQLLGFAASSAGLLLLVRPVVHRQLVGTLALPNSPDAALLGRPAVVTVEVRDASGQVRVDGELWNARPVVAGDVLAPGAAVFISSVDGATVRVLPADLSHDPHASAHD